MGGSSCLNQMTKKSILDSCIKNKLYRLPHLNDVLYLHFQGYGAIEALEEYTELKCLWLESNAISKMEGLDNQKNLKCLFLQNNLIEKIENLEACQQLDTLNLCHNYIKKIENCGSDKLPLLNTLNISHNCLRTGEQLEELKNCGYLSVLDISHNKIEDVVIVKILSAMPQLRVLTMTGNPVMNMIPQYRKTLILECKELTYLDSRPVFPRDRACAEAWKRGGFAEEQREHSRWVKEERKKTRRSINALLALRKSGSGEPADDLLRSSSDEEDTVERSSAPGPSIPGIEEFDEEQVNLNQWKSVEQQCRDNGEDYSEPTSRNTNLYEPLEKPFDPLEGSSYEHVEENCSLLVEMENFVGPDMQLRKETEATELQPINNDSPQFLANKSSDIILTDDKKDDLVKNDNEHPVNFPIKQERSFDENIFPINEDDKSIVPCYKTMKRDHENNLKIITEHASKPKIIEIVEKPDSNQNIDVVKMNDILKVGNISKSTIFEIVESSKSNDTESLTYNGQSNDLYKRSFNNDGIKKDQDPERKLIEVIYETNNQKLSEITDEHQANPSLDIGKSPKLNSVETIEKSFVEIGVVKAENCRDLHLVSSNVRDEKVEMVHAGVSNTSDQFIQTNIESTTIDETVLLKNYKKKSFVEMEIGVVKAENCRELHLVRDEKVKMVHAGVSTTSDQLIQTNIESTTIDETVLLKNYKNQTEHSQILKLEIRSPSPDATLIVDAMKIKSPLIEECVEMIGPKLEIDTIQCVDTIESRHEIDAVQEKPTLPTPWHDLYISDDSSDSSDFFETARRQIKEHSETKRVEEDMFQDPNESKKISEDLINDCIKICLGSDSNGTAKQNDEESETEEDEIIECIETLLPCEKKRDEIVVQNDTENGEEQIIEEQIEGVSDKPKEEVWEIDLNDNEIKYYEKSPDTTPSSKGGRKKGHVSFLLPEDEEEYKRKAKPPSEKLFLINKLLESRTDLTFGMDNTLTVGGVLEIPDVEKLQLEHMKERTEKLQNLVDRIYERRDEINARFDKIQAIWGNFKNPYKGMEGTKKDSGIIKDESGCNDIKDVNVNELLKDTVALIQDASRASNNIVDNVSDDPRTLTDWKDIYLQHPLQQGLLSSDLELTNEDDKVVKAIVSLIIESCVEFNMMREFQFVRFDENLKFVVQKYRKRLQTFLNFRNNKDFEPDELLNEWRTDRGMAHEYKSIFLSEDELVREKLKQLIFHEYSIDFDNDEEKLFHLWRIILTCKQVYLAHKVGGTDIKGTNIDDDSDSPDSE